MTFLQFVMNCLTLLVSLVEFLKGRAKREEVLRDIEAQHAEANAKATQEAEKLETDAMRTELDVLRERMRDYQRPPKS